MIVLDKWVRELMEVVRRMQDMERVQNKCSSAEVMDLFPVHHLCTVPAAS
jgi:hypothetical protein